MNCLEDCKDYLSTCYIKDVLKGCKAELDSTIIWGITILPYISKYMCFISNNEIENNFNNEKIMVMEALSRLSIEYSIFYLEYSIDKYDDINNFIKNGNIPIIYINKNKYLKYIDSSDIEIPNRIGLTVLECSPSTGEMKLKNNINERVISINKEQLCKIHKNNTSFEELELLISYPVEKIKDISFIIKKSILDNLNIFNNSNLEYEYKIYSNLEDKATKDILIRKYEYFNQYIKFLNKCISLNYIDYKNDKGISCEVLNIIEKELDKKEKILWNDILKSEKDFYKNIRSYLGVNNVIK